MIINKQEPSREYSDKKKQTNKQKRKRSKQNVININQIDIEKLKSQGTGAC